MVVPLVRITILGVHSTDIFLMKFGDLIHLNHVNWYLLMNIMFSWLDSNVRQYL